MKSLEELAEDYQRLLREKFSDIIIRLDPDVGEMYAGGVFAAFSIPDSREEEYAEYIYGEFPVILHEKDMEFVSIVIHRDSDTEKYYPALWREIRGERRPRSESPHTVALPPRRQRSRAAKKSVLVQ